jgi:NAD-dependent dihydropyrimidine dehydrogenase PreA subunit
VIENEKCKVQNPDDCAGCMSCVEACPEKAIQVTET